MSQIVSWQNLILSSPYRQSDIELLIKLTARKQISVSAKCPFFNDLTNLFNYN